MLLEILVPLLVIILCGVCFKLYIKLTTGKCTCKVNLHGKTVIVTGANSGLGKETALELAARGARVILACRNLERGEDARQDIIAQTTNSNVVVRQLNLMDNDSIREFSKTIKQTEDRLDILINNAGAGVLNTKTANGIHPVMQINYFGPFLLTNLLLDLLKKSAPSRIIHVASKFYYFARLNLNNLSEQNNLSSTMVYNNSKLCNILFSNELARRLEGTNVTSNCLHPGLINTNILRNVVFPANYLLGLFYKTFYKSVKEGIQTTIHLAVAEDLKTVSGGYFEDCKQTSILRRYRNQELQKQLWELSEKAVHLKEEEKFVQ